MKTEKTRAPQPRDYVFVRSKKSDGTDAKAQLMRVEGLSSDGSEVRGRLEKDPHIKSIEVIVPIHDVLLNVGRKPHPGKVHGYDLKKLYRRTEQQDDFGDVHFFTNVSEDHKEKLWSGLERSAKRLRSNGLDFLLTAPWVLEILPKQGKYAGMFIGSKNPEERPSRIHISAEQSTLEGASIGNYTYVMLHEIGHLYHLQFLRKAFPELNAKWIELFTETIGPKKVDGDTASDIGKRLLASGGFKNFLPDASEDDIEALKLIRRWLSDVKRVSASDVSELLAVGTPEAKQAFKSVWPRVDIHSKSLKPLVTEYACKNYRELFAEAFAFYLLGKELPKRVQALMEESIGKARSFKN